MSSAIGEKQIDAQTMETEPIIRVDQVYKRFIRSEFRPSLRHEMGDALKRLAGASIPRAAHEPFYALKDISFTVNRGESIALVGRNGSGKTTLLRLLSGITRPTSGTVAVHGRYASLIALGAGFSPEMSGRDNIYLNAAIQGFLPKQVREIEDEIIAFADIGTFIDQPVKRYSSGMYARLGFSIAVHILPDIIFVDEILAVGDAAFQAKCYDRIAQLKAEGRTFIIVTHNAVMSRRLCERALWLYHGELKMNGNTDEVLQAYQDDGA